MSRFVVHATWEDCPHLSDEVKQDLLASIPPYQHDARSKGIPQLGSGAIYPLSEADIVISDFPIPAHYPRVYGMDVGWNRTAAIWGAKDLETGVVYLYSEHYRGQAEPVIHAESIKSRGKWIPGVIDPASRGRGQKDGVQLLQVYRDHDLDVQPANSAREAGIFKVWTMLSSGKLKVFKSCGHWIDEFRIYRRDENGKVVKAQDHLMDATRYLVMSGIDRIQTEPVGRSEAKTHYIDPSQPATGWMM